MLAELLEAILFICGMFGIGLIIRRCGYLDDGDITKISRLVIDVLFPMLIFNTVSSHLNYQVFTEVWALPLIGFSLVAIGAILGWGLQRRGLGEDQNIRKTFVHMCAVNNFGFIPIILVQKLWGDAALAQLFFLHLGSNIGLWTIGVGVLGQEGLKGRLKAIFSPVLISIILALMTGLLGGRPYLPSLFIKIISEGGSVAVPLMLILIGASYYHTHLFKFKMELVYISLVRLIGLPIIYILMLRLLPLTQEVFHISLIVALMPTAMATAILTRRFGGNSDYAAAAAIVTLAFSLVTIPVAFMIMF